jgi:hypothetical protein
MLSTSQAPLGAANRLRAVLLHVPYYTISGVSRLAADTGLSRSTISRLCNQKTRPHRHVAENIAWAICKRSGRCVAIEEIFSVIGDYPTPSACQLMGCRGCLPPQAWDERTDRLKPPWRRQKPGEWSRPQAKPSHPVSDS